MGEKAWVYLQNSFVNEPSGRGNLCHLDLVYWKMSQAMSVRIENGTN